MDLLNLQVANVLAFDRVSHLLNGMAAVTWLPGVQATFDRPQRKAHDRTRPACLAMEVTEDNITLSLSIAWPRRGRLHFSNYGRWDFRAPISANGYGDQLNINKVKHRLNCARGVDMLRALLDYGFALKRGEDPQLEAPRWPRAMIVFPRGREMIDEQKLDALVAANAPAQLAGTYRDVVRRDFVDNADADHGLCAVDARIVPDMQISAAVRQDRLIEDFTPVLGVREPNPAKFLRAVEFGVTANPAARILARHGVANAEELSADHLEQIVVEFRAAVASMFRNPVELAETSIYDALLAPETAVKVSMDLDNAVAEGQTRAVVAAMRHAASRRAKKEATDAELVTAAREPAKPLLLNRLGAVQINNVSAWQEMPDYYTGSIFTPIDWQPRGVVNQTTQPEPVAV